MNDLLDAVNAYHVRVCLQWHSRVDELEARVKQLSTENLELRAQLKQQQQQQQQRLKHNIDSSSSTTAAAAAALTSPSTAESTLGDLMDRMMEPATVVATKVEPIVKEEPVVLLVVDSQSAGADALSPPRRLNANKSEPIDVTDDFTYVPPSNKRRHAPPPVDVVEILDDEKQPPKLARVHKSNVAVVEKNHTNAIKTTSTTSTTSTTNRAASTPKASAAVEAVRTAEKKFRYIEPVLNRAERRKLVGRECEQCSEFYDAVCAATGREPEREAFVQAHSRHREVCTPPPATPPGFWQIDFEETAVRSDATTQSPG